jgi:hypothetical protein
MHRRAKSPKKIGKAIHVEYGDSELQVEETPSQDDLTLRRSQKSSDQRLEEAKREVAATADSLKIEQSFCMLLPFVDDNDGSEDAAAANHLFEVLLPLFHLCVWLLAAFSGYEVDTRHRAAWTRVLERA